MEYFKLEDAMEAFGLSEKTRKYGGDHSGYDTRMLYEIQDTLESLPAADVVERKKGKWIDSYDLSGNKYKRCSECGAHIEATFFANDYSVIFCPQCGADMKEE